MSTEISASSSGAMDPTTSSILVTTAKTEWYDEAWEYIKANWHWLTPVAIAAVLFVGCCCCVGIWRALRKKKPYTDITGKSPPPETVTEESPSINGPPRANGTSKDDSPRDGDAVVGEEQTVDETKPFVSSPSEEEIRPNLEPNFKTPVTFYRGSPPSDEDRPRGSPV